MYDNRYGRFTAVDPLLASGLSANPQTFNRYAYVANNPVLLTDPTGMFIEAWSHGGLLFGLSSQSYDSPFPRRESSQDPHSGRGRGPARQSSEPGAGGQPAAVQTKSDPFDTFEDGSPIRPVTDVVTPASSKLVGPIPGDDKRGRPHSSRNIYSYREALLIQVYGSDGQPYLVTNEKGEGAEVLEEVRKQPGGIEPE